MVLRSIRRDLTNHDWPLATPALHLASLLACLHVLVSYAPLLFHKAQPVPPPSTFLPFNIILRNHPPSQSFISYLTFFFLSHFPASRSAIRLVFFFPLQPLFSIEHANLPIESQFFFSTPTQTIAAEDFSIFSLHKQILPVWGSCDTRITHRIPLRCILDGYLACSWPGSRR